MKRILCVFLVLITSVSAFACSNAMKKYDDSISELRDVLLAGDNGEFSAELISGTRETPFEIDGKTSGKTDYALITVTPAHYDGSPTLDVTLSNGEKSYSGTAVRHPFKQTYSFEIAVKWQSDAAVLRVKTGENTSEITLKTVKNADEISSEKALELALNEMDGALKDYKNGSTFDGEIFIRYIKNPVSTESRYYWYVAFIPAADCQKIIAVLIEPTTGKIEAKRNA